MSTATQTTSANRSTSTPSAGAITEASPREVHDWLRLGEAILIDVREPDEHTRERINGARLLPLSRFVPAKASGWLQPGQKLVMQCRSGRRSTDACRLAASLAAQGVPVVNMAGGIEAWKKESLPVEVNTKIAGISVMRQVQLVIGVFMLAGSALTWFVHPGFIVIPAFFGAGLTFAGATGTCALASLLAAMPWNRACGSGASCARGSCG